MAETKNYFKKDESWDAKAGDFAEVGRSVLRPYKFRELFVTQRNQWVD